MRLQLAALAACVACVAAWPAAATPTLTLADAFARVERQHPELRVFTPRRAALQADVARAALRPALNANVEVENAFGSGALHGVDGAELTLSLASVLERGGKREARVAVAERNVDKLTSEREAKRLDLLAETARRYIAGVIAAREVAIAERDVAQRTQAVTATARRHAAGAVPQAEVLTARAAAARAKLDLARAQQAASATRQYLAALWGERAPTFTLADDANLLTLPELAPFAQLATWLDRTPEIRRFASAARLGEARLQLAASAAKPDIEWQLGVRQLRAGHDFALVGNLSIPFGSAARAAPEIHAAQAELQAIGIEREAAGLALHSTLAAAHAEYVAARVEVLGLARDVLPLLSAAESAAQTAYRAGATSYLEWANLQTATVDAEHRQLAAARDARRALIEIQRLTGQSFGATDDTPMEAVP